MNERLEVDFEKEEVCFGCCLLLLIASGKSFEGGRLRDFLQVWA